MRYRLSCPSCGKAILVTSQDAGTTLLCGACGARVTVPPGMGAPGELTPIPEQHAAPSENPQSTSEIPESPEEPPRAGRPVPRPVAATPAPRPATTPAATATPSATMAPASRGDAVASRTDGPIITRRRWVKPVLIAAAIVAAVGAGLLIGLQIGKRTAPPAAESNTAAFAANERENADLLKLKAEAEELTLSGRLREAHAKYRQLAALGNGRAFKSPLMWDIMERAKVDQDRVYWILMAQMEGADKAFANGAPGLTPNPLLNSPVQATQPTTSSTAEESQPSSSPAPNAFWSGGPATAPAALRPSLPGETLPTTRPSTTPAVTAGEKPNASTRSATALNLAPLPKPQNLDDPVVLDAQIEQSIRRGCEFLLLQFKNGSLPAEDAKHRMHSHGLHGLCTYALATAGQAVNDEQLRPSNPAFAKLLDELKLFRLDRSVGADPFQPVVYARSLRLLALSVYNRPADRQMISLDLLWLLRTGTDGRFTYDDRYVGNAGADATPRAPWLTPGPLLDEQGRPLMFADGRHDPRTGRELDPPGAPRAVWDRWRVTMPPAAADVWVYYTRNVQPRDTKGIDPGKPLNSYLWDNSNTHMALLAIWQAAAGGGDVPETFWNRTRDHWTGCALPNGEWPYAAMDSRGSPAMNLAGLTAMSLVQDLARLDQLAAEKGAGAVAPQLAAGLNWIETGDNSVTFPGRGTRYVGYDLFALERAGTATGFRYFGTHDWYRELARRLIAAQRGDGAWGAPNSANKADAVIDTAFTILFLCHGRQPVMANKLRFEGNWCNRPRDLANASRYVGRMLEQPLGWQVVNLAREGTDWLDAPILYLASDAAPGLVEPDRVKIRAYVDAGGMLLLHADNGHQAFEKWAEDFAKVMWPDYPLRDLPDDHELYSITFKIPPGPKRPRLRAVSNGARILALLSVSDQAGAWQSHEEKARPEPFQLATNLYVYATGKIRPPRIATPYIEAAPGQPTTTFKIARIKFDGNWDPEPGAWKRFTRVLRWETGAGCEVTSMPAAELKTAAQPLLVHITGTGSFKLTEPDLAALKSHVEAGGVLLIDPTGGDAAFYDSVEKSLLPIFANIELSALDTDLPPLAKSLEVMDDLKKVEVRQFAKGKLPPSTPYLRGGKFGQGYVVVSRLDITSGLLGTNTWGILGFSPDYAKGLLKNIVLWAATRSE